MRGLASSYSVPNQEAPAPFFDVAASALGDNTVPAEMAVIVRFNQMGDKLPLPMVPVVGLSVVGLLAERADVTFLAGQRFSCR